MKQSPIYTLPHGIEVIGEYPVRGPNRYVRVRIRPHRFFPETKQVAGGCYVRRSRVVMASKLGRALLVTENVHHRDEDRTNDHPDNLELIGAAEHNRHHKTGTHHSQASREKIGNSLRRAIAEGRRTPPPRPDWSGRSHSDESRKRMSVTRKARIKSGAIKHPSPPSWSGKKHSAETREKMRQARLSFWASKKVTNK